MKTFVFRYIIAIAVLMGTAASATALSWGNSYNSSQVQLGEKTTQIDPSKWYVVSFDVNGITFYMKWDEANKKFNVSPSLPSQGENDGAHYRDYLFNFVPVNQANNTWKVYSAKNYWMDITNRSSVNYHWGPEYTVANVNGGFSVQCYSNIYFLGYDQYAQQSQAYKLLSQWAPNYDANRDGVWAIQPADFGLGSTEDVGIVETEANLDKNSENYIIPSYSFAGIAENSVLNIHYTATKLDGEQNYWFTARHSWSTDIDFERMDGVVPSDHKYIVDATETEKVFQLKITQAALDQIGDKEVGLKGNITIKNISITPAPGSGGGTAVVGNGDVTGGIALWTGYQTLSWSNSRIDLPKSLFENIPDQSTLTTYFKSSSDNAVIQYDCNAGTTHNNCSTSHDLNCGIGKLGDNNLNYDDTENHHYYHVGNGNNHLSVNLGNIWNEHISHTVEANKNSAFLVQGANVIVTSIYLNLPDANVVKINSRNEDNLNTDLNSKIILVKKEVLQNLPDGEVYMEITYENTANASLMVKCANCPKGDNFTSDLANIASASIGIQTKNIRLTDNLSDLLIHNASDAIFVSGKNLTVKSIRIKVVRPFTESGKVEDFPMDSWLNTFAVRTSILDDLLPNAIMSVTYHNVDRTKNAYIKAIEDKGGVKKNVTQTFFPHAPHYEESTQSIDLLTSSGSQTAQTTLSNELFMSYSENRSTTAICIEGENIVIESVSFANPQSSNPSAEQKYLMIDVTSQQTNPWDIQAAIKIDKTKLNREGLPYTITFKARTDASESYDMAAETIDDYYTEHKDQWGNSVALEWPNVTPAAIGNTWEEHSIQFNGKSNEVSCATHNDQISNIEYLPTAVLLRVGNSTTGATYIDDLTIKDKNGKIVFTQNFNNAEIVPDNVSEYKTKDVYYPNGHKNNAEFSISTPNSTSISSSSWNSTPFILTSAGELIYLETSAFTEINRDISLNITYDVWENSMGSLNVKCSDCNKSDYIVYNETGLTGTSKTATIIIRKAVIDHIKNNTHNHALSITGNNIKISSVSFSESKSIITIDGQHWDGSFELFDGKTIQIARSVINNQNLLNDNLTMEIKYSGSENSQLWIGCEGNPTCNCTIYNSQTSNDLVSGEDIIHYLSISKEQLEHLRQSDDHDIKITGNNILIKEVSVSYNRFYKYPDQIENFPLASWCNKYKISVNSLLGVRSGATLTLQLQKEQDSPTYTMLQFACKKSGVWTNIGDMFKRNSDGLTWNENYQINFGTDWETKTIILPLDAFIEGLSSIDDYLWIDGNGIIIKSASINSNFVPGEEVWGEDEEKNLGWEEGNWVNIPKSVFEELPAGSLMTFTYVTTDDNNQSQLRIECNNGTNPHDNIQSASHAILLDFEGEGVSANKENILYVLNKTNGSEKSFTVTLSENILNNHINNNEYNTDKALVIKGQYITLTGIFISTGLDADNGTVWSGSLTLNYSEPVIKLDASLFEGIEPGSSLEVDYTNGGNNKDIRLECISTQVHKNDNQRKLDVKQTQNETGTVSFELTSDILSHVTHKDDAQKAYVISGNNITVTNIRIVPKTKIWYDYTTEGTKVSFYQNTKIESVKLNDNSVLPVDANKNILFTNESNDEITKHITHIKNSGDNNYYVLKLDVPVLGKKQAATIHVDNDNAHDIEIGAQIFKPIENQPGENFALGNIATVNGKAVASFQGTLSMVFPVYSSVEFIPQRIEFRISENTDSKTPSSHGVAILVNGTQRGSIIQPSVKNNGWSTVSIPLLSQDIVNNRVTLSLIPQSGAWYCLSHNTLIGKYEDQRMITSLSCDNDIYLFNNENRIEREITSNSYGNIIVSSADETIATAHIEGTKLVVIRVANNGATTLTLKQRSTDTHLAAEKVLNVTVSNNIPITAAKTWDLSTFASKEENKTKETSDNLSWINSEGNSGICNDKNNNSEYSQLSGILVNDDSKVRFYLPEDCDGGIVSVTFGSRKNNTLSTIQVNALQEVEYTSTTNTDKTIQKSWNILPNVNCVSISKGTKNTGAIITSISWMPNPKNVEKNISAGIQIPVEIDNSLRENYDEWEDIESDFSMYGKNVYKIEKPQSSSQNIIVIKVPAELANDVNNVLRVSGCSSNNESKETITYNGNSLQLASYNKPAKAIEVHTTEGKIDGDYRTFTFTLSHTESVGIGILEVQVVKHDYERAATKDHMGTICLPYNVPADHLAGARFYKLLGKKKNGLIISSVWFEEVYCLEAGKPYMFLATNNFISADYDYESGMAVHAGSINGMHGTYDRFAFAEHAFDDYKYYIVSTSKNAVSRAGNKSSAGMNRAYMIESEIPLYQSNSTSESRLVLNEEGFYMEDDENMTAIEEIKYFNSVNNEKDSFYNLSGQPTLTNAKGVIISNRKVIFVR